MRFSKRQRTLGRARHPWSTLAWTAYGIRWLPAVYTRCWHKTAKGLLGGPRTSSICERSSQSTVWLLGPSATAATVRLHRVIPDPTTLLPYPFRQNATLQHYRLPSVTTDVTRIGSKTIFPHTSDPRGHEGAPMRWGTQGFSPASVWMVNTPLTPSESHENGF
jgi:hypothetical protein